MSKAYSDAKVVEVADQGRRARVSIEGQGSCCACSIAKACDKKPQVETVDIEIPVGVTLEPGDRVKVSCPSRRYRGMLWNVAVPCGVLIAANLILHWSGVNPQTTAGTSLLALVAYYLWLMLTRRGGNKWRLSSKA